jgi:hypothetical protein
MGKKKSATQTTNQYQYMAPPTNPYYKTAEGLIEGYDGGASASREAYGRNINQINESGNEFLGSNTPDEVRSKVRDSRLFKNNLNLGAALGENKQNEIAYKNNAYMSLGGATAPQLVQTGGNTNTQQWGSGLYSPLGQFGLQAAGGGLAT